MEHIERPKLSDYSMSDLVFCATTPLLEQSIRCSAERVFLIDKSVNRGQFSGHSYIVLYGYHCSCYGFDDTMWEAAEFTAEELVKITPVWLKEIDTIYILLGEYIEQHLKPYYEHYGF